MKSLVLALISCAAFAADATAPAAVDPHTQFLTSTGTLTVPTLSGDICAHYPESYNGITSGISIRADGVDWYFRQDDAGHWHLVSAKAVAP